MITTQAVRSERGDSATELPPGLARAVIGPNGTLLDGLRAINDSGYGIAFVCDAELHLMGTLSDGDVRRAILSGTPLGAQLLPSVMNREFSAVLAEVPRVEVLDLMRALGIEQVPVVDGQGRLRALHLLHELIGGAQRPNWAVIVAGGKGTRLAPLTQHVPKPMLKVAGRPILERLVLHLVGSGIRRIFLSINHLGHIIEEHFGDGSRFGCVIEYLREDRPLGTGGGLGLLPETPADPVLVMNGDLVVQLDVGKLLDSHCPAQHAATIGLKLHEVEIPFGVATTCNGLVTGLEEKPKLRHLVNAGVYVISPSALELVPPQEEFPMTRLIERCLERGLKVGGHVLDEEWIDVGRREELARAQGTL